jgi:hypothetical protein
MAAYAESDRVQIRQYLGYSAIFLQADPRLESAITASLAVADGGTRPDNSTQTLVLGIVTKLQATDTAIDALDALQGGTSVDGGDVEVDAARELARLRSKGRQYVYRLARIFDTEPIADVFGAGGGGGFAGQSAFANAPFNGRSGY